MVLLRPYQQQLVSDIRGAMRSARKVVAVSPTGSGKTVVFSYLTYHADLKQNTVYVIVHRQEILQQISVALSSFGIKHGIIMPGRTPTIDRVQVGMIQTIVRRLDKLPVPRMIIIDECHHAIQGSYAILMDRYPDAKVLGVTASPERMDGRGLGEQFDVMVQGPSPSWLIEQEFLADFDYYAPDIEIDLSNLKTRMGDYESSALSDIMDKPKITGDAVSHYRNLLDGKSAIAFCVSVVHAQHVAETFNQAGIASASIDGTMSSGQRSDIISALRAGRIKVLTSCDLVSEGFDIPAVSGAIMLRPTKSLSMYLQQCGRVLRPKPDGSKAVILDHVGNFSRFGTPKTPRQWSLDSKKRKIVESGVRQCKSCFKAFDPEDFSAYQCSEKYDNDKCLFSQKVQDEFKATREIQHVDGQLRVVTDSPEWAGGINVLRASGQEWKSLIAHADSYEKLREIGKLRNYHHAWAKHMWGRRGE
jgi:DNA repair protein RadD